MMTTQCFWRLALQLDQLGIALVIWLGLQYSSDLPLLRGPLLHTSKCMRRELVDMVTGQFDDLGPCCCGNVANAYNTKTHGVRAHS